MLVKMQCPHCGANMEIDDAQEKVFCSFCGTALANLKERVEITQNVNYSGTVVHVRDRSNESNLIISYTTAKASVAMVVRIVTTGQKSTYLNGQVQTYHLMPGAHQIVLKIGKKNYSRTIVIPQDNSPVRIYAAFTGRHAEITIDQPYVGNEYQQALSKNNSRGKGQSALAIISFILSLTGFGAIIGIPLAVWDIIRWKKDQEHKHGLAVAALIIGLVLGAFALSSVKNCNSSTCRVTINGKTCYINKPKNTASPVTTKNPLDRSSESKKPVAESTPKPTATSKPTAKPESTATPVAETEIRSLSAILISVQTEIETLNKTMTDESKDLISSACSDYSTYKENKQKIQDFYLFIDTKYSEHYSLIENACIEYYKQMLNECDMNNYKEWDSAIDDLYNTWDAGLDEMYDCWDDILTDLYTEFDTVISDGYDINYADASAEWTEMYRSYSDTWSAMYRCYSDNWSLLYHEYIEVFSTFYRGDTDVDKAILKAKGESQEQNSAGEESTELPETTGSPETQEPTAEVIATGIRPEFQKAMDEYLAFFEEYCEFMEEYSKSPTAAMLLQYAEFLEQYEKTMKALDEWDTNDMTSEETRLYLDTVNKINKMLLDLQNNI